MNPESRLRRSLILKAQETTEEQYHEGISVEMSVQITLSSRDSIPAEVSMNEEPSRTD